MVRTRTIASDMGLGIHTPAPGAVGRSLKGTLESGQGSVNRLEFET